MEFCIRSREALDSDIHACELERGGLVCAATVVGRLAADCASVAGELALDGIMGCRPAGEGQAEGLGQGSGFLVLCGRVERVFADGGCDLVVEGETVMLDADELPGLSPVAGDRLSLAFKELTLVLPADD